MFRIVVVTFLLLWTSTAYAQKVVLFLKPATPSHGEVTDPIWWVNDQPVYSATDDELFKALTAKGLNIIKPTDLSRISRIVRQADLSDANARNLANLLGADIALVGTLRLDRLEPLSALPLRGVRVTLDARVINLKDATDIRPLTTSRASFARYEDLAKSTVLEGLSDSLKYSLKGQLPRPSQPVGWTTEFAQLHISGLLRGVFHDMISERLRSHPLVQNVETLWVAPGVIAIKLTNSKREPLSYKDVDEVARNLMSETFDEFRLTMTAQPVIPNTVELNVSTSAP